MDWQQLKQDKIYFDSDAGVPGTTWPIGTPGVPSDVIADVITMCAARNLHRIQVHGALTLGAAMQHYCFFGSEHEDINDILDLSDEDVDGSHMEGLIVTGGQGGATFLTLIRCIVNALTDFNGRMNWCSFWGGVTSSFKDGGYIDLVDCESIYGAVTIQVQAPARASIKNWRGNLILTLQDGGLCYVRGFKGTLEIDEMTAGTLSVYANGADITINADCSGGTINIYGNATVTDNSGATVVNDYTLDDVLATVETDTDPRVMGRSQIFEKSITSAANVGDVPLATITDQPCLIESIVIHADTAQPAHMTSCGVFGGAAKVITFIAAADALQADLDAEDKQVYWEGKVRLAATKTIVISLVGSGADNVDLTVIIKYRASVSGGYLA